MPATGTAADAGRTLDAFLKLNTSVGNVKRTANSAVQSVKINGVTKTPTGGVVDLGTITGGGASDTTLTLTYSAATGKWTWVDANKVTQTLSASNQPAWSSYTNVLPMAPDVLDLSTVDMSLIPTKYPIFVPLSAADAAGLVTIEGGGGSGNATMNPIPYTDLAVV